MNDSPRKAAVAEDAGGESSGFSKQYEVAESKPKAFMVENAQWKRLRGRVNALESTGNVDWLLAIATMIGGIAASAGLALLALPNATKDSGQLAPSVLVAGAVVAVVMVVLWVSFRSAKSKVGSDICDEMDTIKAAWNEGQGADA